MAAIVLSLNLKSRALTQYNGFVFNSMAPGRHQSLCYGAKADGIYAISKDYRNDDGAGIDAVVVFQETDLRIPANKRFRKLIFGMSQDGDIVATISMDEQSGAVQSYTIEPPPDPGRPDLRTVACTRRQNGRFIELRLENVSGSWFDLHSVDAVIVGRNLSLQDRGDS